MKDPRMGLGGTVIRDQIVTITHQLLIESFELSPERLLATSRLREDLGFDSLDTVDLIVTMESILELKSGGDQFHAIRTLGDVYGYIEELHIQSKVSPTYRGRLRSGQPSWDPSSLRG